MNTCATCLFRDAEGYCNSQHIMEDIGFSGEESQNMLIYSYSEGGSFKVGPNFGCVHHTSGQL